MINVSEYVRQSYPLHAGSVSLSLLIDSICRASTRIADVLSQGMTMQQTGLKNVHGEAITQIDQFAQDEMLAFLRDSNVCSLVASEESHDVIELNEKGEFIVAIDPLDGSGNSGVNVPTGTIFSIYRSGPLGFLRRVDEQVAAGYFLYGPATLLVLTVGRGTHVFVRRQDGYVLLQDYLSVPEKGNTFSINVGNRAAWTGTIQQWLDEMESSGRSLRYVGSLVADVHRTLLTGGVFVYPEDRKNPNGKLRLLYEVAPMAFLAYQARAVASSNAVDVRDLTIDSIHQRAPLALGSRQDVSCFDLCYPPHHVK